MKIVRRWAGLWILSLVVALAAATALPGSASASAAAPVRSAAAAQAPAPVQMNFACTSKATGLMRYVASTSDCTRAENTVTIVPGPIYTCIYFSFFVRQVASASRCTPASSFIKELTLPPTGAPVYFCALKLGGLLTYTANPGNCNSRLQFPVVVPVPHHAPVLANIESSTLTYDSGTPPVPITSSLTVSDASSTTLASATVSITAGLTASDDSLGFTNQNGITGSYNASTGVLTLTGTASLADYQAALRSVTYKDANALTAAGNRTISFQVNDGAAASNLSNVVTRTIAVATNTPPTCKAVGASTDKNTAINITVLSSCSDPDGDTLTLKSVDTTGTKGTVAINSDGTIHYDPNGQFQGLAQGQTATDTFTFTVSDGFQDSAAATVTVTINGVNDKPVISNVESTPLSYQSGTAAVAITGTLTLADDDDATIGGATVSITSGFSSGADTLAFTNQNGITGSYDSTTGVLTLTGSASVADYQAALRSVEFASTDTSASPAARVISFQVTDTDSATSNTATRTINVSEAAQPPVISNVETTPLSYQSGAAPVAITSTLTLADPGDSTIAGATVSITSGLSSSADTLSFTSQNGITGSYSASTGVLTLTGNASVADYQAALRSVEFATTDSSASPAARVISFQVTDTNSAASNTATRTIDVSAAAQPPTAVNQSYNAVGNTTLAVGTTATGPAATVSGTLLTGDSGDASCGSLSVTGNTTPGHGTATVNPDGSFTYLPAAGFTGTDTFQYTITCGTSAKTATATVTITVGTLVWYVDDSKSAAGNGESSSPFNTLAAANSAAGANSIVFLYQGNATYTGGTTMKSGESLFGQPHGLTVSGHDLVAAGGSNPAITNSGGDGIDLASNADVEDVTVSGASATGINGSGITGTVTIANSTVTGSGVNNAVITDTSGTLNLTVTDSTFSNSNPNSSQGYGLNINPDGSTNATVSVTGSTFTDNADTDFDLTTDAAATGTNSVTFSDNQVSGGGGVLIAPTGSSKTTITVDGNNIQNVGTNNGIGIDNLGVAGDSGTITGTINGNTVGTATAANSGGGIGIDIFAEGAGTETLAITNNKLFQYQNDAGINFLDREGSPTMNLTITGNTIADPGSFGSWGLLGGAGAETGDAGTVCADISGNSMTGSAAAAQGGADFELDQGFSSTIKLPGYTGGAGDTNAVVAFVQGKNTSSGTPSGIATVSGSGGGFTGSSGC
jgi:VCBS repeat-containing protein